MRRDKSEVASQKTSLCFNTQSDTLIIQILDHCIAMPPTARFLSPLTLRGTGTLHTTWRYSDQKLNNPYYIGHVLKVNFHGFLSVVQFELALEFFFLLHG